MVRADGSKIMRFNLIVAISLEPTVSVHLDERTYYVDRAPAASPTDVTLEESVPDINFDDRDLYSLTEEELSKFFALKESQYAERRKRVAELCDASIELREASSMPGQKGEYYIVVDPKDRVAYCSIAKVHI